jgi:hypothetical protein
LLQRLDLAEYLDWIAYYAAEPWGESRADQRLAVQLHYTLSPWMPEDSADPPSLLYPYFEDPDEAAAAIVAAQAEYQRLEAAWISEVEKQTKESAWPTKSQ